MRRLVVPEDYIQIKQDHSLNVFNLDDRLTSSEALSSSGRDDEDKAYSSAKRRRVRHACVPCRQKKVKCDGNYPCAYCVKFQRECTHPFRPTMPSKPRPIAPIGPQPLLESSTDPSSVASSPTQEDFSSLYSQVVTSVPRPVQAVSGYFGNRELKFVDVYVKLCHDYIPVVSPQQVKEALRRNMLPTQLVSRTERARTSAFLAAAWAAAAIGASFYDPDGASQCLQNALAHVRTCFDNPIPETINAYLAVCEAYYRLDVTDTRTWTKYVGFANVLEAELSDQLTPEVKSLFDYYRTIVRNNTTTEVNSIEYPTRHTLVEARSALPSHIRELDLLTMCIQHTYNITKGRSLDPAELRRQTELFLVPLTAAYERLTATGERHTSALRFYVICLFLVYFNVKLGKIPTAITYLHVQIPLHEIIPLHRWPRARRIPFLTLRVLEVLQCWGLADFLRKILDGAGVRWDGMVDRNKVDEIMWVDMYNDAVAYQRFAAEQPENTSPKIYEIPFNQQFQPQLNINASGVIVELEDESSRDVTYEVLQPHEYEALSAFLAVDSLGGVC